MVSKKDKVKIWRTKDKPNNADMCIVEITNPYSAANLCSHTHTKFMADFIVICSLSV